MRRARRRRARSAVASRWVQRFSLEFIEAALLCRHAPGDGWFAGEPYVKVAGRQTYLYRVIDQHGQVIDVLKRRRSARIIAAGHAFVQNPAPRPLCRPLSERTPPGLVAL